MKNPTCMKFQLLVAVIIIAEVQGKLLAGCVHKQFVEYRTRGLILCQFPQDDFDSIYWYDNTNGSGAEPTLTYDGKEKNGDGYFSGEFDIHDNGTLIINNVSLLHEKNFKVVWFLPSELFNTYHIEVEVTVTPTQMFPRINNCSDTKEVCNIRVPRSGNLTCSVNRAKPASQLEWFMVVDGKEKRIETLTNIIPDSNYGTYHSSAVIVLSDVSATNLGLFVCSSRLKQFDNARSKKVLVDMLNVTAVTTMPVLQLHREMGRRAELKCSSKAANMFLWRKVLSNETQLISFSVLDDVYVATTQIADHYQMRRDGTLYIESSKIDDEGKFICLSSDGVESNVAIVELLILVPPSPSYIVMEGCSTGLCLVAANEAKAVTCTVTGVRPAVLLQWHITDEEKITITNQDHDVLENMGLYDTKASLQFYITTEASCGDILTVTCQATGAATELFRPSKDLRFQVVRNCTEESSELEVKSTNKRKDNWKNYFLSVMAVFFILFISIFVIVILRIRQTPKTREPGMAMENQSLINITEETRKSFMEQIQTSYKETVLNSKSAYYVPNHLTVLPFQMRLGQITTSQKMLDSFEHIFTDPELGDKNVLIEAHYLIYHCDVDQHEHFLRGIDIPSNSQLFIYTCGLCEDKETFTMIINHLLANQRDERYPYHITDCIVECFGGSRQEYHVKDLLQKVCELEYIFNFKEMDSTDLRNAKIYLFNTCKSLKLPIKTLSLYSRTTKITKTQITIEGCQTPLNVPEKLKTFVMDDLNQKIKDTDVLYLVEQIDNISEIIIRSSRIPRYTTSSVFDILRKRERRSIFVIWITFEGEELQMISYPSEVFNCWLNSTEIMAVNLYRKTTEWKELRVEDRFRHEKKMLKEINKTSARQFLEETLKVSQEKVDALFGKLKRDLDTLRNIIVEWHNLYDSDSKENEESHRAQFDKLVEVLRDRIKKAKTGSEKMRSNPELQVADNEKESGNQTSPTPPVNKLRLFSTQLRDAFFEFQLEDPSEIT